MQDLSLPCDIYLAPGGPILGGRNPSQGDPLVRIKNLSLSWRKYMYLYP